MSSLWTPGGEHPGDRPDENAAPKDEPRLEELSPEEREQVESMAREMAAVREQLASVPAAVVVANHLMGLYELGSIHLSQQPPNLAEASVAIDALGAVVDKLPGRLGETEATMRDALHQIRLAYVAVEKAAREADMATEQAVHEADVQNPAEPEPAAQDPTEPEAAVPDATGGDAEGD